MRLRCLYVLAALVGAAGTAPAPAWGQTSPGSSASQYLSDTGTTLDSLVEAALKHNGDLLAERGRIAEAAGALAQARLRPNPSIDASYASGRLLNSPGENEFSIGYSHTFELGGKRGRRVEVAEFGVELATLEIADRERLLKSDVKARFAEALAAARNLSSAEELYELNRQSCDIAEARTREGEGTPLEAGLLRVEVNRIASDRLLFANQTERALLELKILAGLKSDETLRLSGSLSVPRMAPAFDRVVEHALAARPDLKAARLRESAAEAEVRLAKSEASPDMVASTRYSHVNSRFDQYGLNAPGGSPVPIRATDNLLTAGVSMTLPLRNRNQGNIQSAVARQASASLRRQYLESVVREEVRAALERYQTAARALAIFDAGVVRQSSENVRILRAAYDLGEIRLIDVINEQRRLIDVQRQYTDLLLQANLAAVEIERAAGGPVF